MLGWTTCFSRTKRDDYVKTWCLKDYLQHWRTSKTFFQLVIKRQQVNLGSFLDVEENVATVAFLTDIFTDLNPLTLNLLQGKGKLACKLLSEIKSFS